MCARASGCGAGEFVLGVCLNAFTPCKDSDAAGLPALTVPASLQAASGSANRRRSSESRQCRGRAVVSRSRGWASCLAPFPSQPRGGRCRLRLPLVAPRFPPKAVDNQQQQEHGGHRGGGISLFPVLRGALWRLPLEGQRAKFQASGAGPPGQVLRRSQGDGTGGG